MKTRRKIAGLRILITGASQGIGRALAVEAARQGARVLAAARSVDLLAELAREIQAAHPERVLAIQLMRNFGQHNALMCGFRQARGRYTTNVAQTKNVNFHRIQPKLGSQKIREVISSSQVCSKLKRTSRPRNFICDSRPSMPSAPRKRTTRPTFPRK